MMKQIKLRHRQQGVALVIFAASMLVIIGIAALALDLSNSMLHDARIQNAMDACALSAAQGLMDEPSDLDNDKWTAAEAAALVTFNKNSATEKAGLDWSDINIKYSATLDGVFDTNGPSPRYVRCAVDQFSIKAHLAKILKIENLGLNVTAVAGPIPINPCTPAPLLVCGDPENDPDCLPCRPGDDCPLQKIDSNGLCYGFDYWRAGDDVAKQEECYLKACPPGGKCQDLETGQRCGAQEPGGTPDGGGSQVADISAGNFELLDVYCKSGKKGTPCIKEAFTEGGSALIDGCPTQSTYVTTKPGNTASVIDAFNTIFDGPNEDDHNTADGIWYSDYLVDLDKNNNKRRILGVVIGDCEDPIIKSGKTQVPVLTVGCFFATQRSDKNPAAIWGQFVGECDSTGEVTTTQDAFDIYKVVLYKDYTGPDS